MTDDDNIRLQQQLPNNLIDGKGWTSKWKRSTVATLDVRMEEISGGGTDVRPTQIVLVFDAGGNCVSDTALMNPSQLVGR
jgi:hypothetical protein